MNSYHQPKWKGRKIIRRFVAAMVIGTFSLSVHHVYKKTEQGWNRYSVFRKDIKSKSFDTLAVVTTIFLLSGTTTWLVPADFGSLISVECIAAGSSGNSTNLATSRAAGGGGAYAKITSTSTTLVPGVTSVNVGIGTGAAVTNNLVSTAGGDAWWNATSLANAVTNGSAVSCAAQGGQATSSGTGGLGGTAANSVGTTKFSAGNGSGGAASHGGGGAAGPNGAGTNGSSTQGGNADNNTVTGPTATANGNSGTEFDATHGCGTGALNLSGVNALNGGLYGGGGCATNAATASGTGGSGLLVIKYNVAVGGARSFGVIIS